jgi:tetratricopeptide (TPR) repeat protein
LAVQADAHIATGSWEQARPVLERALDVARETGPAAAGRELAVLERLAAVESKLDQGDRALESLARALELRRATVGPLDPTIARTLAEMAALHAAARRTADAIAHYQQALDTWELIHAAHPETPLRHDEILTCQGRLAELYHASGRAGEAEAVLRKAYALASAVLGARHAKVAAILDALSKVYRRQKQYDRAARAGLKALAIWEIVLGKEQPQVLARLARLADLYRAQGEYVRSEPLYRKALAAYKKSVGLGHPDAVPSLTGYATLLRATRRPGQAEAVEALVRRIQSGAEGAVAPSRRVQKRA